MCYPKQLHIVSSRSTFGLLTDSARASFWPWLRAHFCRPSWLLCLSQSKTRDLPLHSWSQWTRSRHPFITLLVRAIRTVTLTWPMPQKAWAHRPECDGLWHMWWQRKKSKIIFSAAILRSLRVHFVDNLLQGHDSYLQISMRAVCCLVFPTKSLYKFVLVLWEVGSKRDKVAKLQFFTCFTRKGIRCQSLLCFRASKSLDFAVSHDGFHLNTPVPKSLGQTSSSQSVQHKQPCTFEKHQARFFIL